MKTRVERHVPDRGIPPRVVVVLLVIVFALGFTAGCMWTGLATIIGGFFP